MDRKMWFSTRLGERPWKACPWKYFNLSKIQTSLPKSVVSLFDKFSVLNEKESWLFLTSLSFREKCNYFCAAFRYKAKITNAQYFQKSLISIALKINFIIKEVLFFLYLITNLSTMFSNKLTRKCSLCRKVKSDLSLHIKTKCLRCNFSNNFSKLLQLLHMASDWSPELKHNLAEWRAILWLHITIK